MKVAQSCLTLCDPMEYTVHRILQAGILELGSLSLLQGIFPTQGSNWGLPHFVRILYQLSHKGSHIYIYIYIYICIWVYIITYINIWFKHLYWNIIVLCSKLHVKGVQFVEILIYALKHFFVLLCNLLHPVFLPYLLLLLIYFISLTLVCISQDFV